MIENKFDRTYPNLLIEDVAGLPRGYINSGETEQIIKNKSLKLFRSRVIILSFCFLMTEMSLN